MPWVRFAAVSTVACPKCGMPKRASTKQRGARSGQRID